MGLGPILGVQLAFGNLFLMLHYLAQTLYRGGRAWSYVNSMCHAMSQPKRDLLFLNGDRRGVGAWRDGRWELGEGTWIGGSRNCGRYVK